MTVPSAINKSGPYHGNGATKDFDYGFRIVNAAHVRVILTDADGLETTLALNTDYTVSGVGGSNGQVALKTAPGVGQLVTLIRNVPFIQETDLENQGPYYAQTIEDALDLATMRDQQLQEQIDRAVKIPASASPSALDTLIGAVLILSNNRTGIDTVAQNIGSVIVAAEAEADIAAVADDIEIVRDVAAALPGLGEKLDADGGNVADQPAFLANVGAQPALGRIPVAVVNLTDPVSEIVLPIPSGAQCMQVSGVLLLAGGDAPLEYGAQLSFDGGSTFLQTDEYSVFSILTEGDYPAVSWTTNGTAMVHAVGNTAGSPLSIALRVDCIPGQAPRISITDMYDYAGSAGRGHANGTCSATTMPTHMRLVTINGGGDPSQFAAGTRLLAEAF